MADLNPSLADSAIYTLGQSSSDHDKRRSPFISQWAAADITNLLPSSLPLTKPQRAWDRRPMQPRSRQLFKNATVWKRHKDLNTANGGVSAHQSPAKAVKKMRTDTAFGRGTHVLNWEMKASPKIRRIVTRSAGELDLLALSEDPEELSEVDEVQEDEAQIEAIYPDGTVEELSAHGAIIQTSEWSDIEDDDKAAQTEGATPSNETAELTDQTTSSNEGSEESATESCDEGVEEIAPDDPSLMQEARSVQEESTILENELPSEGTPFQNTLELPEDAVVEEKEQHREQLVQRPEPAEEAEVIETMRPGTPDGTRSNLLSSVFRFGAVSIPEGFVSPGAGLQRRVKRVRLSNSSRRKSAPFSFAAMRSVSLPSDCSSDKANPESSVTENSCDLPTIEKENAEEISSHGTSPEQMPCEPIDNPSENLHEPQEQDDSWEDINDDLQDEIEGEIECTSQEASQNFDTAMTEPEANNPSETLHEDNTKSPDELPMQISMEDAQTMLIVKDDFADLPRHRALRRSLSTPVKQIGLYSASLKPHFVAFTPMQMPAMKTTASNNVESTNEDLVTVRDESQEKSPVLEVKRSTSAPPEEPQMSPRRPKTARISDDTALLQAFLDRAAERRSSGYLSATRRESLENRRDSDSVRLALAGPTEKESSVTILAERDPNSPSPRKSTFCTGSEGIESEKEKETTAPETTSSPTKNAARRSVRVKKNTELLPSSTYSAPNKISIRSGADPVVLKRTEAQELTNLTRKNTRRNKGESVLPAIRLVEMATEDLDEPTVTELVDETRAGAVGGRNVKWAEKLESFSQEGPEPEVLVLVGVLSQNEESNVAKTESPSSSDTLGDDASSKASTKTSTPRIVDSDSAPAQPDKPPATKKRRSRIATPAKPTRAMIIDMIAESAEEASKALPAVSATRKQAVSKLPAPVPAVSLAPAPSIAKDKSSIASPPKKRGRSAFGLPAQTPLQFTRAFSPSLDFSKPSGASITALRKPDTAASLASPAKKPRRNMNSMGPATTGADDTLTLDSSSMPGMGSPAKKRSRRYLA